MMNKIVFIILLSLVFSSCGKEQGDVLELGSENEVTTTTPYLVLNSQDGNHRGFAVYTIDGTFVRGGNFRAEAATPRGLVGYSDTSVLMALDTTDSVYEINIDGTKTLFHGSAQFSGAIYDTVVGPNGNVYVIESNRIEVFDADGVRLGSSLINTTTGGCSLNAPRGMTLNANNELVVVNAGGSDQVLTYDISGASATCVSAVNFGNNPYGVLFHSDGSLYITTQGNDQVYRADPDGSNPTVIWSTDTSLINNPTGIVELPNGDLLIASTATDSVERITTSGVRVGTVPFIRDTHSLNIGDMVIIGNNPDE